VNSTRISRRVNAPCAIVYRALLDARAVATWMVPTGMSSHVHAFDAREGGSFRISLTYDAPTGPGKTTAHTDTFHGQFVKLVTNEQVVEVVEFETTDPALRSEMTITIALADADGGTDVLAVHDGLPRGVPTYIFPPPIGHADYNSRNLPYPMISDPAALPIRVQRHSAHSIETARARIVHAIIARLSHCPACHYQRNGNQLLALRC
jgi:uncharacterized protein YndB with AHSA1/START domain